MWNVRDQLLSAAAGLGIEVRVVPPEEQERLIREIATKYAYNGPAWPSWERYAQAFSVQDQEAWQWVGDYVGSKSLVLFFNPHDEESAFLLRSGSDLVMVLGELFGIEFYVTNYATDYVLCFNHHDYLIAVGNAVEWLQQRCGESKT